MANKDGGKPGADGGANDDKAGSGNADPSKDAGNQDDKSGEGKGGDGASGGSAEKKFSQEELDAIVERRLARAKKDADENAKLSKEQLLEKERDEALSKVRMSDARDSWIATAAKDGLEYGQASRLFRYYRDDFEFDDKGKVENLKDVLKEAKSEWPEMFKGKGAKPGGGDLGGGQGGGDKSTGSGMNDMIRRAAGRGNKE
jgi:hypothetical protein